VATRHALPLPGSVYLSSLSPYLPAMSERLETLKAALADRYTIQREVGHGGMATVYLAEDLKHHRKVAVKVLRPDLAASLGAERFIREIEVAAQLTHPHILPLHDSGEADGFLYYVMPFIDGDSLRQRIEKEGELPVPEALRIIREVVDALSHAHEHGVVHRDIKPDNVMLSGRHAMVTDFGVAKAVSEATGRQTLTTAGIALGTPAYMSPEQAAADPHVDHRADIYAVGVMAYELLTGRPPFVGASPQQVLSAHVTEQPEPVTARRATIPPALDQLIMKCLAKRPADRWQSADEMLPVLEGLAATPSGGLTPTGTIPVKALEQRPNHRVAVAAGVVVAIGIVGFLGWSSFRSAPPVIIVSNIRQITRAPEVEFLPVLSPGGREVAYATGHFGTGEFHIAVRDLGGGRALPLTEDRPGVQIFPRWTADGERVVFVERRAGEFGLYAIPRFGGPATPIPGPSRIGSIYGDSIAYRHRDSLMVQSLQGGAARFVATIPGSSHSLAWSPDGSRIVGVEGNIQWLLAANIAPSSLWVLDMATGRRSYVTQYPSLNVSPQWLPDGRGLLFISDREGSRDVYAVWLTGSGEPGAAPTRVTTGLDPHSITISHDGSTVVYSELSSRSNVWQIPLSGTGPASLSEARPVTVGNQTAENHGLSPDGRLLAYDSNQDGNQEIYVVPVEGGEPRQLTTDPGHDFHPEFSPDGNEIVFYSMRYGTRDLFLIPAGGGTATRLTDDPGQEQHPSFSPDGLSIAYMAGPQVAIISRDHVGGEWSLPRVMGEGGYPSWSSDGEWMAIERGRSIIALGPGGQERVIVDGAAAGFTGASWPALSLDGETVYFRAAHADGRYGIWAAPTAGGLPSLVVDFDDPSLLVTFGLSVGHGTLFLTLVEVESDIYAMDLEY
jgi:Tol biopolymer transport system component/serine/threonine protein kinase